MLFCKWEETLHNIVQLAAGYAAKDNVTMAAIIRIFKAYGSPQNKPWVNTYEVGVPGTTPLALESVDPAMAADAINTIVTAERILHMNTVHFIRATYSTWAADSQPYDPDALFTQPLSVTGNRIPSNATDKNVLDRRMVLIVNRQGTTGRPGRIFYRACLDEVDIANEGGYDILDTAAPIKTAFTAYTAEMISLIGGGDNNSLAMIGGTLSSEMVTRTRRVAGVLVTEQVARRKYVAPFRVRAISQLVLGGVTTVQDNHAYFDRA